MEYYTLTESQMGFYYEWAKNHNLTEYNVPYKYAFSKSADPDRIKKALQTVFHKHPVYYTRFTLRDGQVMQYADTSREIPIERITASESDMARIESEFVRPFDLHNDCLVHAAVVDTEKAVYMLLDNHHTISDGTSLIMFLHQISMAYNGEELPDEQRLFFDYAAGEKATFSTPEYEKARDYYRQKFAGLGMTRTTLQKKDGVGLLKMQSAFSDLKSADAFCSAEGVTPNLLFMAAFACTLSAFSLSERVAFYTVSHGRGERSIRKSFGSYVKSAPILADTGKDTTVIDFIKSMKSEMMSTIRYGVYPFSHFCQDMKTAPETSFTFQPASMKETVDIIGEAVPASPLPTHLVNCNINVVIFPCDEQYEIRVEYNDARHTEFEMRNFAAYMKKCAEAMVKSPSAPLRDLKVTTPDDTPELAEWTHGEETTAAGTTFLEEFTRQAEATPQLTAVVDEQSSLTYAQLDSLSDRLAALLAQRQVTPGDFVAIQMPRRKEWIVAILAIFKCRAAYVPLSPDMPRQRIDFIRNDSGAKIVIDEQTFRDLDATCPDAPCGTRTKTLPSDRAYMIYTSGSTGTPKGVVISHRALTAFVAACRSLYRLDSTARIFCHSSFSFDASVEDIFPVLTRGGQLHIFSDETRKDPALIAEYITRHGITGGNFTTRLGVEMLDGYDLPLDYLTLGGEKLEKIPHAGCRLFNSYGPTEFTVDATFIELNDGMTSIPIGRPTPGTTAYVLDSNRRMVPPGCVGELYLSGPQMADGYWRREELSAKAFVENPFATDAAHRRMYRTGDYAWWNADGQLEYFGRRDNQYKINGYRIETGEIEHALLECDGVTQAVANIADINGRKAIVAYYSCQNDADADKLRRQAVKTLPEYMVPSYFVRLDNMPYTTNGKIDYAALPLPDIAPTASGAQPATAEEAVLLEIIKDVTENSGLYADSDLFDNGMTSMQVIETVVAAEKAGIRISVSALYEHRNVRDTLAADRHEQYFWADGAMNPAKPLMVLVCGYPYYHPFYDEFAKVLAEKYSVLVFESFNDFFMRKRNADTDTLLSAYKKVLETVAPNTPVYAVTGYCMGAELAIRLAEKISDKDGNHPKVLMMEGIYERPEHEPVPEKALTNEIYSEHYRIADLISGSFRPLEYDGDIVIALASRFSRRIYLEYEEEANDNDIETMRALFAKNRQQWHHRYPDAPIIDVDADHWTFLTESNTRTLMQKAERYWNK